MSGVPSAFILVLVEVDEAEVLVVPAGVVIVLDLVVVPALLVIVLDLLIPAGLLIVPVAGTAVWAWAAPPSRLSEMRKPMMRFIKRK